jgi:hypothetical protein
MRIGIVAIPRSGGHNFCEWLSNETDTHFVHEPVYNSIELDNRPDLIVKWLINEWRELPEALPMDKWIGLIRTNTMECAISYLNSEEANWVQRHVPYNITPEWIVEREGRLREISEWISNWNKEIQNAFPFTITYEGIYESGEDIPKVLEYLSISNPVYLHMLDRSNRLRNKPQKPKTLIG